MQVEKDFGQREQHVWREKLWQSLMQWGNEEKLRASGPGLGTTRNVGAGVGRGQLKKVKPLFCWVWETYKLKNFFSLIGAGMNLTQRQLIPTLAPWMSWPAQKISWTSKWLFLNGLVKDRPSYTVVTNITKSQWLKTAKIYFLLTQILCWIRAIFRVAATMWRLSSLSQFHHGTSIPKSVLVGAGEEGMQNYTWALTYFCLEVTHTTSAHISLAHARHIAMPNLSEEEYNFSVCPEGRQNPKYHWTPVMSIILGKYRKS